jgi:hypothetical protein
MNPEEEVEMGLLAGAEHASEGDDSEELEPSSLGGENGKKIKAPLTREDKKAMTLLIVLCAFRLLFATQTLATFVPFFFFADGLTPQFADGFHF